MNNEKESLRNKIGKEEFLGPNISAPADMKTQTNFIPFSVPPTHPHNLQNLVIYSLSLAQAEESKYTYVSTYYTWVNKLLDLYNKAP